MGIIVVNMEALRTAGAKVGVFGDARLAEHLGVNFAEPLHLAAVARILTLLPVDAATAFTMVSRVRRPVGGWQITLPAH